MQTAGVICTAISESCNEAVILGAPGFGVCSEPTVPITFNTTLFANRQIEVLLPANDAHGTEIIQETRYKRSINFIYSSKKVTFTRTGLVYLCTKSSHDKI